MDIIILNYLQMLKGWSYLVIFLGMLLDGNITLLVLGFILNNTYGNYSFLLLIPAFLGAVLESIIFYNLGARIKNSPSKIILWAIEKTNHFDEHFLKRPKITLFLSKFIYGAHRASIIRIGILEPNFKKYLKAAIPVDILWMGILTSVGIGLKITFHLLKEYLKYAEIIFLLIIISLILFQKLFIAKKIKEEI